PTSEREHQATLRKGSSGLFMNIGDCTEKGVVLGFRRKEDGTPGPAEACGKIRAGDVLVAINGVRVTHLKFNHIIKLLQRNDPYIYLRFYRPPPKSQQQTVPTAENLSEMVEQQSTPKLSSRPLTSRFRG